MGEKLLHGCEPARPRIAYANESPPIPISGMEGFEHPAPDCYLFFFFSSFNFFLSFWVSFGFFLFSFLPLSLLPLSPIASSLKRNEKLESEVKCLSNCHRPFPCQLL